MKLLKRTFCSFFAVACCCAGPAIGQDLTEMTLKFDNVTGTNINQTVAESNQGNEKEVEFGDYDNDGDLDILVAVALSDFGQRRNKLYRNDNGVLQEVSGTSVIPEFSNTDTSRSGYLRDYNNDGRLDIIIINDSNSGTGNNSAPGKTKLLLQDAAGNFVNTSQNLSNQTGAACNGISMDFDGNGLADLMMCNYPNISQDSLGLNGINGNAAGQFTVVTNTNYPAEFEYGVHSEGADMNGDGKIDILIANWTGDPSFIYYNNNNNAGSGDGDFRYGGNGASTTFAAIGGGDERAMIPGDFNNDGLMDMYFANRGQGTSTRSDFLYINTGNDANNKATFSTQQMPSAQDGETHKVDCCDLDGDGKLDLVVMANSERPYVYRNISAGGNVEFIEWTPAGMSNTHRGWHANAEDITGNGRPDIFVGANSNDHMFSNDENSVIDFDSLAAGILPAFHNSDPIAVSGDIAGGATETLIGTGIPVNATVSVLVRSESDVDLTIRQNGNVVASSSRSGDGVEEGVQFNVALNAPLVVEVTNQSSGAILGDVNGDGSLDLLDVQPFVAVLSSGGFNPAADMNGDGSVDLLDVAGFVDALSSGGGGSTSAPYVIEFNSRTN